MCKQKQAEKFVLDGTNKFRKTEMKKKETGVVLTSLKFVSYNKTYFEVWASSVAFHVSEVPLKYTRGKAYCLFE